MIFSIDTNTIFTRSIDSHKLENFVHIIPALIFTGDILYPLQRMIAELPFSSTAAFFQISIHYPVASVTVKIPALFLHHFPDRIFEFLLCVDRLFAMLTQTRLFIDKKTSRTRELKLRIFWVNIAMNKTMFFMNKLKRFFPQFSELFGIGFLIVEYFEQILDQDVNLFIFSPFVKIDKLFLFFLFFLIFFIRTLLLLISICQFFSRFLVIVVKNVVKLLSS